MDKVAKDQYEQLKFQKKIVTPLSSRYNYFKTFSFFNNDYFVFGDKNYHTTGMIRNRFDKVIKKADVKKITFHGLRHSHASLLLSNPKIPENLIAERMGHTVTMLRKTYSHVYKKSRKEMITYIENL